jgi:hypothetical protein
MNSAEEELAIPPIEEASSSRVSSDPEMIRKASLGDRR